MKKLMIVMMAVLAVTTALATGGTRKRPVQAMAGNEDGPETAQKDSVEIRQYPKIGSLAYKQFTTPSLSGASNIGVVYKKPRYWEVFEVEYLTKAKALPQLTFTWHVLLETKTATNKDREGQKKMSPYSYFTQSTTYFNIPRGSHAASVCLHPSYLECYGEAVAVAVIVTNQNGDELAGDTITSLPKWFKKNGQHKFWEDSSIMDAKTSDGDMPMIERRQGLLDRSKTIWALVNPNDYEVSILQ